MITSGVCVLPFCQQQKPKPDEIMYPCSIWGPTCDGLDRIVEQCNLPDMQVGDWLVFETMGAYTVAASSTFNGFQRPDIHYVMSRPAWLVAEKDSLIYLCLNSNYRCRNLMATACLFQEICPADSYPGHASASRRVVPARSAGLLWQREWLGHAYKPLSDQCCLNTMRY